MATRVKTWASMFYEDSISDVLSAVKQYMKNDTKGFAPSCGQLMQYMKSAALPAADTSIMEYRRLLKLYKKVAGKNYEPVGCIKEHYGYKKCEGCNEQTKCRPAAEKKKFIESIGGIY